MFNNIISRVNKSLQKWNTKQEIKGNKEIWDPKLDISNQLRLSEYLQKNRFNDDEIRQPKLLNPNSKFINFEGIDNSGKTTVLSSIKKDFPDAKFTTEPTKGTWIGKQVRNSISQKGVDDDVVLYLFLADHVNHIKRTVKPAIYDGSNLICDRYIFSRCAYQAQSLHDQEDDMLEYLLNLHRTGNWSVLPTKTIYIDVPAEVSIKRMEGENGDVFEKEDFLSEVRENYKELISKYSEQFKIIDGTKSKQAVKQEVKVEIRKILKYN